MGNKKHSVASRITNNIIVILTLLSSFVLLLTYISSHINPNHLWHLAFLGLGAPFIFLVNVIFLSYWTFRLKPIAFIPLAVILIGLPQLYTFFRPKLSKDYPVENVKNSFRVMTSNIHGLITQDRKESTVDSVKNMLAKYNPDIVCFQEYQTTPAYGEEKLDSIFSNWPYRQIFYIYENSNGGFGLAVLSKFPISNAEFLDNESQTNASMKVDVKIHNQTVTLYNNHLQTTQIDGKNKAFFQYENFARDTNKREVIVSIAKKLKDNYCRRAIQVDTVSKRIRAEENMVIVCGDFNDTPISYTYRQMRGDLKDSFIEAGRGFHYTYNDLFNMLRIDYIFCSKEINVLNFLSPEVEWSDHNPVITDMVIPPKK